MLNCGRRNFSIICLTQYFHKSIIEQHTSNHNKIYLVIKTLKYKSLLQTELYNLTKIEN